MQPSLHQFFVEVGARGEGGGQPVKRAGRGDGAVVRRPRSSSADDAFFGVDVASPGAGDDPCDLVPPVGTAGSTVSGGGLSLPQSPSFLDAAAAAAAI